MNTEQLLAQHGWTLECESPLEIRHEGTNSVATGFGAQLIIANLTAQVGAVQVYNSPATPAPPVASWPLPEAMYKDYVDTGTIVTFTALVPLEQLVFGYEDELNAYCKQAFGDNIELSNTEFRVWANSSSDNSFDDKYSGDVALQVTCTLSSD